MKKVIQFLNPGFFPFSICLLLGVFIFFYRFLNLPSPTELTLLIEKWFGEYRLRLLFLAAFIEGIFIIGMYFPGSLAIALAIYTLGKTPLDFFYIGIVSFCAFFLANICNYFLGKYGFYRFLLLIGERTIIDKMHAYMKKNGDKTFFMTGFLPNFIAITSVCAGVSKLSIPKTFFYQATSLVFWVTVWTIAGSLIVKQINLKDNNQSIYILVAIFLWGVFLVIKGNFFSKK